VMIALYGPLLVSPSFQLVVSGINRGDNCGLHVIYSGTVGAAREAACKVCVCYGRSAWCILQQFGVLQGDAKPNKILLWLQTSPVHRLLTISCLHCSPSACTAGGLSSISLLGVLAAMPPPSDSARVES
jgi:hypothetical protein